jgi:2-keto-4-pentenoate hydratase/2-oxohepta-3-ene-1,7-dioic acid hydratase in catechol pathway
MKLCSFILKASSPSTSTPRVGLVWDHHHILDLCHANASLPPITSMYDVIAHGEPYLSSLRAMLSTISSKPSSLSHAMIPQADIQLLAPIPRPRRNVICVGKNYIDHINEVKAKDLGNAAVSNPNTEMPKYPQFFTKSPDCVIGPYEAIESHSKITKYLDYEAELAVIIGKEGRDISYDDALDYVYGYSIANDVTARDLQRQHGQWFKGKTLDSSCPMGPYLVPKAEIPDVQNLAIQLKLNGNMMQNSNTSKMVFNVREIIRQLSSGFTLRVGDVILTGTPDGKSVI